MKHVRRWERVEFFLSACMVMVSFAFGSNVSAATFNLPGNCSSISVCVSSMSSGDTLLIADGTYSDSISGIKANTTIQATNDGKVKFTGSFNPGSAGFTMQGIIVKSSDQKDLGSNNTYRRMSFVGGPSCGNTVNSLMGSNTKIYDSAFYGLGGRYLLLAYQQNGGIVVQNAIFRPDGGWGNGSSCNGWEPHAAYNMYDTEGFAITGAILVDAISSASGESENIGGQVINTHQSHANVGTISQSAITTSGGYGRFASDGAGSHNVTISDSITKGNSLDWGMTRNVNGTTTATRFDTDKQVSSWKGSINRTTGANFTLNSAFLNDSRWRQEMCVDAGVTRGFCAGSSLLGDYVAANLGISVSTPDTTSPTWPSGTTFSASATSSSSITVTWSSATDNVGVTSYTVQRCTGLPAACPDASFATVGTPAASPFVNNTGLSPNTDYSYRVRASDAAGNVSGWTNTVSAKTQPLDTTPPTITLTAPTSTLSSGTTSTTLSVTTDKNATCRYATTAGVTYASMTNTFTTTGATTHSTTISGLTTGTTHRYVRCINGNTGGQPTTTDLDVSITVSAPAAPVITSATTAGGTTGTAFSYQITATNNPTSFSATNLPSWALINTTSGIISGTPTSAGTATVTIGATNATGTGTTTLVVTVAVTPPISQNLLLGLNFNEGTGTTAQDVSGHNHTGTLSNATWTTGKNGGGISFSGNANSYIDIPNESDFDLTTNFTVSLWMKTSTFGSAWAALVSKGDSSWSLTRYNTANTLDFNTFSPSANDLQGTVNVASNTWHHVAIVYDGATKKLYVDGAVDAQASFTQTLSTNNFPVRIGGNAEYTTGTFNGSVDDVRIYNKALTQAEITTDMNTPLTQPTSAASCNTVTTSNFSQSAYNAYGAPFDAFQTSTNLLDAKCNSTDTHTINLTTGITGDTTRIVYTKGYYYDPVTTGWTQYSGTCNGALNGEWCQGSVSATIASPNISTASAANPTYVVGMTCSVQGGSWKCGCRDATCSNFYWQVQGAGQ